MAGDQRVRRERQEDEDQEQRGRGIRHRRPPHCAADHRLGWAGMRAERSTVVLVMGPGGGAGPGNGSCPCSRTVACGRSRRPAERGGRPAEPPDLSADAAAVARVLDDTSGTFVVCGHSYGAWSSPSRRQDRPTSSIVSLCAFMPDAGESLFTLTAGLRRGSTCSRTAGRFPISRTPRRSATRTAARRRARTRSRSAPAGDGALHRAGHHRRLAHDPVDLHRLHRRPVAPIAVQREVFALRAREVVELGSSHQPFFSQPERVAKVAAGGAHSTWFGVAEPGSRVSGCDPRDDSGRSSRSTGGASR